jgi:hypothetical protein
MIVHTTNSHPAHQSPWRCGTLYLNDKEVGAVTFKGRDGGWGFGEFMPAPAFSDFAMIFGRWSLLMHADGEGERLSAEASEELRDAEYAIDAVRAALRLQNPDEWHELRQVNIDGGLIEWHEA